MLALEMQSMTENTQLTQSETLLHLGDNSGSSCKSTAGTPCQSTTFFNQVEDYLP